MSIFFIIGLVLVTPSLISGISKFSRYTISFFNDSDYKYRDKVEFVKYNYPLLSKYKWSSVYFQELHSLPKPLYKDYVGWKQEEYTSDTLNILQRGIRKTTVNNLINNDQHLFFGGSAMWGFGVSDNYTMPSIFSKISSMNAINYGQPGYVTRQSLSALINLYSSGDLKKTNNFIIFYDGYNDVLNHCTYGLDLLSTIHEVYNQQVIRAYKETSPYSIKWGLIPAQNFYKKLKSEYYLFMKKIKTTATKENCFDNNLKAKSVAYSILNNWYMADAIAKANGDKFIAILQPSVYSTDKNNLNLNSKNKINDAINLDFQAVYPILKSLISEYKDKGVTILDFSNIFDKSNVFISDGHVTPEGNTILVRKLYNYMSENYY